MSVGQLHYLAAGADWIPLVLRSLLGLPHRPLLPDETDWSAGENVNRQRRNRRILIPEKNLSQFQFLGTFAKFLKATINFVMSVRLSGCPSARSSVWNNSAPTTRISYNFIFGDFSKICRSNPSFIKIWGEQQVWINLPTWCNMYCIISARHVSGLYAHFQEQVDVIISYIYSIWRP